MKPNYSMQFLLPFFRKSSIQIVGLSLTLALAGCSSVKSSVDKGAVTARTFSFLNTGARQMPNASRKQAHELVQQAAGATKGPEFLARINDSCAHCPVRALCPAQAVGGRS